MAQYQAMFATLRDALSSPNPNLESLILTFLTNIVGTRWNPFDLSFLFSAVQHFHNMRHVELRDSVLPNSAVPSPIFHASLRTLILWKYVCLV